MIFEGFLELKKKLKNRGRLIELPGHLTWPGPPPRHAPRARSSNIDLKSVRSESHFLRAWVEILMLRLVHQGLMEKLMKNLKCKAMGWGSDTPVGRGPGEFH